MLVGGRLKRTHGVCRSSVSWIVGDRARKVTRGEWWVEKWKEWLGELRSKERR